MARTLINGALALATLAYPIAIYLGLQHLPAGAFGLVLAVLFSARALLAKGTTAGGSAILLAGVVLVFAAAVWLTGSGALLLYYPVLVNAALLLAFLYSLAYPPSAIERLARLAEPDLPASGVRYTRGVTWVWCAFFAANGSTAAITAARGDLEVWTLYNGLIAYILMIALFGLEYLVRRRFRRMHVDER